MKPIRPNPSPRDDGGLDFIVPDCPAACYSTNKEGTAVDSCPFLTVRQGHVHSELFCTDCVS